MLFLRYKIIELSLTVALFTFYSLAPNTTNASVRGNMIKDANVDKSGKYTFAQCRVFTKKVFDDNSKKKKAIIIGDSMSCDFLNTVLENNFLSNYQIQVRFIPYQCQPILEQDIGKYIALKDQTYCANTNRADSLKNSREQILKADLVIFSSRWKPETAQALPRTIKHFGFKPQQKVVVIGSKNFGKINVRHYLSMSPLELRTLENDIEKGAIMINSILSKGLGNKAHFVDPIRIICGADTRCPVFTNDLKLISYDGRHLTKNGARYVGRKLFQQSVLGKL